MASTMQVSAAEVLQQAASTFAHHTAQQPSDLASATQAFLNTLQAHQDTPGLQDSVGAANNILADLLPRLEDAIEQLDACITAQPPSLRTAPSHTTPPPSLDDLAQAARRTLQYAHRLSYTSFAPYGYVPGAPLGHFRPPAPQEHQMCFSGLHQLSSQLATTAAAPPQEHTPTADPAAAITTMLAGMGIVLPPGFRPPPPPPGWKPGDAIDFPPELLAQLASMAAQAPAAAAAAEDEGMDFGLMLGEELQVEVASEGSSEADESDDDDDDDESM